MNTQHIQKLEIGEEFKMPRRSASPVVLTEGELLVQAPAQWLADTILLPAPEKLKAPALIPVGAYALVALRPSSIEVPQTPPQILQMAQRTVVAWMRVVLSNPTK